MFMRAAIDCARACLSDDWGDFVDRAIEPAFPAFACVKKARYDFRDRALLAPPQRIGLYLAIRWMKAASIDRSVGRRDQNDVGHDPEIVILVDPDHQVTRLVVFLGGRHRQVAGAVIAKAIGVRQLGHLVVSADMVRLEKGAFSRRWAFPLIGSGGSRGRRPGADRETRNFSSEARLP